MVPDYLEWSSVTPWALLFGLTGLTCAILTVPAWRHRDRPGGAHAAALMAATAIYAVLYALELQAPTLGQQLVWAKLEYLGLAPLPLAWFFFARSYTGSLRRVPAWLLTLLYAIPLATILLVVTNELHGFFWGDIHLQQLPGGEHGIGVYEHKAWFWVQITYAYLLVLTGGFILIQAVFQYPSRYRWRAVPLLLGALAPWVGNALYAFGVRPAGGVDLTALAFLVTAVCIGLSIVRFDFLRLSPSLLPMAHEKLFEQMKDLVLAIDVDQRVVWANEAARKALDGQDGRLAGRPLAEVMPDAPAIARDVEATDAVDLVEATLVVDGARRIYDVADTPLSLRPGEDLGRLLVLRDITERRKAETALRDSELKLRHSQRMEAIGRLAGGIAHDFNNLLTVILGYGEMVLMCEDGLSDSARQDLTHMKQAAEKAKSLTAQILAFSRRQPREVRPVRADHLIDDVTPLLRRALGEDIALRLDLTARDIVVEADPDQLTQVFMNLAVNARDAMPQGGVMTVRTDTVGEWWRARVTDTGAGVDDDTLQHLFEPFFTTKSQGKETGLGLAMVYGIIKQSHGDVIVTSAPGAGTTFEIVLPIHGRVTDEAGDEDVGDRRAAAALGAARAATEDDDEGAPAAGSPCDDGAVPVILLVEDEPDVRDLAARTLREAGYQVLTAPDGPDALAIAHDPQNQIDLLLADIVLPRGLRGDEVAQALRSERPHTKVLFVSGYAEDSVVYTEHLAADAFYLNKPYTPESLAGMVRQILHR